MKIVHQLLRKILNLINYKKLNRLIFNDPIQDLLKKLAPQCISIINLFKILKALKIVGHFTTKNNLLIKQNRLQIHLIKV